MSRPGRNGHGSNGHDDNGNSSNEPHTGDHHDHIGHGHRAASRRALVIALIINTVFLIVELIGALLSGSLTLLAEAAHMLTDSMSLGLALVASWLAERPPDAKRTYGYQRAEVLGALANGLLLLGVVGYVLYEALRRFQSPPSVDAVTIIVVGFIGLFANLAAAWVLQAHRGSLNIEGAFLHLIVDAAGSLAAVGLGVALLFTDLYILDPLFAVLIAGLVLYATKDLLANSLNILLQGTPRELSVEKITAALGGIDGVEAVHDVHAWALNSSKLALSAHVVAAEDADQNAIIRRAQQLLGTEFGVDHATIQVETGERIDVVEVNCYEEETPADATGEERFHS